MKILLVTGSYPPMRCGVGDYTYNLAKALHADPKNIVGILSSSLSGLANQTDGFKVFPVIKAWKFKEVLTVIKIIHRWSPDIVHIQYPTQGYKDGFLPWILPMLAFLMGKRVVQTWHEGYNRSDAPKLFLKSVIPSNLVFVRPNFKKENLHWMLRWAIWCKSFFFIPNASSIPCSKISSYEKEIIKKKFLRDQKRLVVFFGFVYPAKGVEFIFDIADPIYDQIIIAGEITVDDNYAKNIKSLAESKLWQGKTTITGYLPASDIADLLSVADVVILPFRGNGGGSWNTSIHGAVLNGAFVITTSQTQNGYDKKSNVYYSKVDNIEEMQSALASYAGKRREYQAGIDTDEWQKVASSHVELYASQLHSNCGASRFFVGWWSL